MRLKSHPCRAQVRRAHASKRAGAGARRKGSSNCGRGPEAPISSQRLEAKLGTAPVAALVVVPDLIVRLHPEPLRDLAVLTRLTRKLLLNQESLMCRLCIASHQWHPLGQRFR
eukprot:IDg8213t1